MAREHLYEVIRRDLADGIHSGKLKAGQRLESETDLSARYGVSRMTVRQALGRLEADGLVARRHGSGTFVTEQRTIRRQANRLAPFHEELGLDEADLTTKILEHDVRQPPDDVSQTLASSNGSAAIHLVRLRVHRGEPIAVQESWIPYFLAPSLARGRLVHGSLYRTLSTRAGLEIAWAEQQVSAAPATERLATLLEVEVGSPLLRTNRVSRLSTGDIIEVAESFMTPQFPTVFRLER